MEHQDYANVWDALTDSPEESANMTIRSILLIALQQKVKSWEVTQAEAARRLGVTQPRLNDLLRSKIDKFSLDKLINLAARQDQFQIARLVRTNSELLWPVVDYAAFAAGALHPMR
jgi:predicted XRE-type DNA-binding protein